MVVFELWLLLTAGPSLATLNVEAAGVTPCVDFFSLPCFVQAWTAQLNEPPMVTEDGVDTSEWPQKNLIVAISSDRGLCGGKNRLYCCCILCWKAEQSCGRS